MSKVKITGPTVLTIVRIFLSILFLIFVLLPGDWPKITALVLFVIGAITDFIDGDWARKSNLVTDLGAFLDPLADKMLINLAILALTYLNIVPVWVFAIILVRDFAVDGIRMMVARERVTVAASIYGKLKTTTQLIAIIVLLLNLVVNSTIFAVSGNILLYIALFLTVFSGIDYIIKGWKKLTK